MLKVFRNRFFVRTIAILMTLVMTMPTFAVAVPEVVSSLKLAIKTITGERPPAYSAQPRPRPTRTDLGRDKDRSKWWTPQARAAYDEALLAASGNVEGFAERIVASITPGLVMSWGSGSTAGYPIPGEGSFPGGGSRKFNKLGASGVVNSATSNLTIQLPVVSFPTRGDLSVDFTLYHNSQTTATGAVGNGWTHTYSTNVVWNLTHAFVEMPDGLVVPFTKSGPNYIAPVGFFGTLVDTMTGRKLTMRDQTVYHYTTNGGVQELTEIEDRHGNQLSIVWSSGELQSVTAPDGRALTFTHSSGKMTQIDGPGSKVWGINVVANQLISVQFPEPMGKNRLVTFDYDLSNNIIEELDPEGESWTWSYSGSDCTGWLDPATTSPAAATFTPVTGGLKMTKAGSGDWEHYYSGGLLWLDVDAASFYTEYVTYDTAVNLPDYLNDNRGMMWLYTYNSMGQVLTKQTPLGKIWTYTYTAKNDIDFIDSPVAGEYTDYVYDGNDRLWKIVQSVDATPTSREIVEITYDAHGQVDTVLDGEKRTTDYDYSGKGELDAITPPDGTHFDFIYDDYSRLLHKEDKSKNDTYYAYDETGWLERITHADTSYVEFAYDDAGRKTDFWDELSRHQTWDYDETGRMVKHTNARGDENDYVYTELDQVYVRTNENGSQWWSAYTPRGELWVQFYPDYDCEFWTHDENGNVSQHTFSGSIFEKNYTYDDDNRLTDIDYPSTADVTFDYDDANRRIQMVDGTGTTDWDYNLAGDLIALDTPQGDMTYTYNDNAERTSMTEVGLGTTNYSWNAGTGQLDSLTNRFSETTSYTYEPDLGYMTTKTHDNGSYTEYTQNNRYRVDSVTHRKANTTIIGAETYTWNVAGELDDKTVDSVTTTYSYDLASQLTNESRFGFVVNYTYDTNGNRQTKTLNSVTETYVYLDEKLMAITGGSDPRDFSYDAADRTIGIDRGGGDVTTIAYDDESRATQITRPGMTTNVYAYNGLDTRVGVTDTLGTRGFKRDGAYVTDPVLADGTRAFTPGVSQRQSSTTKFVLDDYLGTTGRLLDSGENVTDTFTYDAFGVQTARTGSTVRPFGYAGSHGYQEDGDTGFKLLGHRYYDPSTGRFLTPDPVKAGNNWSAYCENNPLSRIDPEGFDYHDPMNVSVAPGFKGKVWAVGEPDATTGQVVIELKPGQSSPVGMDVDFVVIVYPDGTRRVFFLMGLGYLSPGDDPEYSTLNKDGSISSDGMVWESPPWAEADIKRAKGRKHPKGFTPRDFHPVPRAPTYYWDLPKKLLPPTYNPKSWGFR